MTRIVPALLAASMSFATPSAFAGTALDRLHGFFDGLKTLKADFTQTVQNAQFTTDEMSTGSFVISRPGKFRWHYKAPYEQLIVANGEKVWIYDADLEQVTVKPLGTTLGNTPALLLSGDRPLEESFVIRETGEQEGLAWVTLWPKAEDVSFSQVMLGFDAKGLRRMVLEDNLGQTTVLQFDNVQRNPRLEPGLFEFQPPPGVDVFDAAE